MVGMNRITKVEVTLTENGWEVAVTKEFAPDYGGGSQVFREATGSHNVHFALGQAIRMTTLMPGRRSE